MTYAEISKAEPATRKHSWLRFTPARFLIGLVVLECLLWLSDSLGWFGKGWGVVTAAASVCAAALIMLLWLVGSLILQWRFQFGIRSVFILVLAVAIPCGWLTVERERVRRQTETVERIMKLGGTVQYDWQFDADGHVRSGAPSVAMAHIQGGGYVVVPVPPNAQPPEPEWLRALLGDDFFSEIVRVSLDGTEVTDAALVNLKGLTRLQTLNLAGTGLTDAGLENLKGLTELQSLVLRNTKVSDAGLVNLKGLTGLHVLDLSYTQVTDAGLVNLKGLTGLDGLRLSDSQVTDAGLVNLKGLTGLQRLDLGGTEVTDAGLVNLQGLTGLRQLDLSGKRRLVNVGRLPNPTKVTNGWQNTSGPTALIISPSIVTGAGIADLQKALPNCTIKN